MTDQTVVVRPQDPEAPNSSELSAVATQGEDQKSRPEGKEQPAPTYAVFPPGKCDETLPLNQIVDVFLFSKFVGLSVETSRGDRQRLVLPRTSLIRQLPRALAAASRTADVADAEGGVPIGDWAERGGEVAPLARDIEVDDLDALLATGTVPVDRQETRLDLDRHAVADLLAGRPAVVAYTPDSASVGEGSESAGAGGNHAENGEGSAGADAEGGAPAGPRLVRLTVVPVPGERPAATAMDVTDLALFLARPAVPDAYGVPIPVTLSGEQVRQLRETGRAEVQAGTQSVTLTVEAEVADTAAAAQAVRVAPQQFETVTVGQTVEPLEVVPVVSTSGQPPVFELALYLQWSQTWTLLGYSRGALLNTVSLAPQEETTIEIFTWDRRRSDAQRSSSVEVEDNLEQSDTTRITSDVLNETRSGYEFTFKAGGEFGVDIYDVVDIGASIGAEDKSTFAGTARTTTGFVHESVTKSANKLKQSRQTKVSETVEAGREERVTRKLRNPNLCHTLNLDYFEILEHFSVVTSMLKDRAGLCVLVDNPLKLAFDRETLRVHETALRRALLDRDLADGFAAARLLEQRDWACSVACSRCTCSTPHGGEAEGLPEEITSALQLVGAIMAGLLSANLDGLYDALERSDYSYIRIEALMQEHRRWVYDELLLLGAPGVRVALQMIYTTWSNKGTFSAHHLERLRIELNGVGGLAGIAPKKLYGENTQHLDRAIGNEYSRWRLTSPNPAIESEFIVTFVYSTGLLDSFNDHGLIAALTTLLADYDAFVKSVAGTQEAAAERDDAATELVQSTFGLESVTHALEREAALLAHLNLNGGYYRAELWKALTPATQLALLRPPLPPKVVEPRTVGSFGDKLAFPVRLDLVPAAQQLLKDLIADNELLDQLSRSDTVSLPTAAVTMESRLGSCDSCEPFIHASREQELRSRKAAADLAQAEAEQADAEAERYRARLAANPPQLDDPSPDDRPIRIELTQSP